MTTTFAPWVMRFSTFEACFSTDDAASLEMYLPPPSSIAFLRAG